MARLAVVCLAVARLAAARSPVVRGAARGRRPGSSPGPQGRSVAWMVSCRRGLARSEPRVESVVDQDVRDDLGALGRGLELLDALLLLVQEHRELGFGLLSRLGGLARSAGGLGRALLAVPLELLGGLGAQPGLLGFGARPLGGGDRGE